jgi:hypothetical protein
LTAAARPAEVLVATQARASICKAAPGCSLIGSPLKLKTILHVSREGDAGTSDAVGECPLTPR